MLSPSPLLRSWNQKLFGRSVPDWFTDLAGVLARESTAWKRARKAAKSGPHVLIATSVGGEAPCVALESLLAVALTLRGAQVHVLLCDRALSACLRCVTYKFPDIKTFARYGPARHLCGHCFGHGSAVYERLGLGIHHYGRWITREEQRVAADLASSVPADEIEHYCDSDSAIGEHALAGTLRYFARGILDGEPLGQQVLRRYFQAALLATFAVRRLFATVDYTCTAFHHGIYVPQGLIGEEARRVGVRVANWQVAYRKRRFIFSHGDTYHHTLLSEPTSAWESLPWSATLESDTMDYLKSRWHGTRDWIWFHERPEQDVSSIVAELGLDLSKPCIGLLTNVMWDAQLHYRANAFASMLEWVLESIRYFASRPELQLVIRVHPAEIRGTVPSRQPICDEIRKAYPTLPSNVFVVPPESRVSTYALVERCDAAIIYGTKTGVELAGLGIPVLVAGEAWIRNKGITRDASSREEYLRLLDQLPLERRMDEARVRRARMYAYHFFFRRMIPLACVEPAEGWPPFRPAPAGLADLVPGADPGLDTICDGILSGADFVYPAELYPDARD